MTILPTTRSPSGVLISLGNRTKLKQPALMELGCSAQHGNGVEQKIVALPSIARFPYQLAWLAFSLNILAMSIAAALASEQHIAPFWSPSSSGGVLTAGTGWV